MGIGGFLEMSGKVLIDPKKVFRYFCQVFCLLSHVLQAEHTGCVTSSAAIHISFF